jgi:hypothetical protein
MDIWTFEVVTDDMNSLSSGAMKASEFYDRLTRYTEIARLDSELNIAMRTVGVIGTGIKNNPALFSLTEDVNAALRALLKPDWNAETGKAAVTQLREKVATKTAELARERAAELALEDPDAISPIT